MADFISSNQNKSRKQRSTRVDLTPMVDLGFLLITFFVFTTNLSKPKAMAMLEPKESSEPRPVPESGSTTILLDKNNRVHYYHGSLMHGNADGQIKETNYEGIREVISNKKRNTPLAKLMFLIKATPEATYKNAINILDEMTVAAVPAGHYAELEITKEEKALIQGNHLDRKLSQ